MLTRLLFATGAAFMAVAAPAMAGPGNHGSGGQHSGPSGGGQHGGAERGGGAAMVSGGGHGRGGGGAAFMGFRGGGGRGGPRFSAPQMRGSFAREQSRGFAHQQFPAPQRMQSRGFAHQQFQRGRGYQHFQLARPTRNVRQRPNGLRQMARELPRNHGGSAAHFAQGQRFRFAHGGRQQAVASREPFARQSSVRQRMIGAGNVPQFAARERKTAQVANRFGNRSFETRGPWTGTSYSSLAYGNNVHVIPFDQANRFIGAPVAQVAAIGGLAPLPAEIQYLYPDTSDHYYRYGDGYLYEVDRGTDLIASLVPLLAGGFLPGQYLPMAYMADYVPAYYGMDAFYPDFGDVCNRYFHGVIYQVDCGDGYVENVIPMYAGGYGVGELLPSAYGYYNVPLQYRGLYYDTPDAAYWYSPGAIYQYDPRTSIITSVAALMGPGFAIGQPLPVGYGVYNVPYTYRAAYYDTPTAWYRYSNGYIYEVDPATRLVTAIVASLLT